MDHTAEDVKNGEELYDTLRTEHRSQGVTLDSYIPWDVLVPRLQEVYINAAKKMRDYFTPRHPYMVQLPSDGEVDANVGFIIVPVSDAYGRTLFTIVANTLMTRPSVDEMMDRLKRFFEPARPANTSEKGFPVIAPAIGYICREGDTYHFFETVKGATEYLLQDTKNRRVWQMSYCVDHECTLQLDVDGIQLLPWDWPQDAWREPENPKGDPRHLDVDSDPVQTRTGFIQKMLDTGAPGARIEINDDGSASFYDSCGRLIQRW